MILFAVIFFAGIVIDRVTKLWAIDTLKLQEIIVHKDFFKFEYLENRGAAFGIMQNKQVLLAIIAVLSLIFGGIYLYKYAKKSKLMYCSLALIATGAVGNLIDRIYYRYVVDFICFHYKGLYYFPTFNVADICVTVGEFLMILFILKGGFNDKETHSR